MKKRIITGITLITLILAIIFAVLSNNAIQVSGQTKVYTKEQLVELIAEQQSTKDNAHTMADSARALGWEEDDKLIVELQEKWDEANTEQILYQKMLNVMITEEKEATRIADEKAREEKEAARWNKKKQEYPAATTVWLYMKNLGWNDYVCAGIMGNLMAEVGGQTLNLNYTASSNGYYGMCQWNRAYSQIWGANLQAQCDFLRDTIKYEFDTYGFKYQKGFTFNSFLSMADARQAALAFAKSYERCGSGSYGVRQNNAVKAYNYFTN